MGFFVDSRKHKDFVFRIFHIFVSYMFTLSLQQCVGNKLLILCMLSLSLLSQFTTLKFILRIKRIHTPTFCVCMFVQKCTDVWIFIFLTFKTSNANTFRLFSCVKDLTNTRTYIKHLHSPGGTWDCFFHHLQL